LAGHPPSADLDRITRILKIENDDDMREIAVRGRREISIALIQIEAVYALAAGFPAAQKLRFTWIGDIIDADSAEKIR
jgi:hypothetical protein